MIKITICWLVALLVGHCRENDFQYKDKTPHTFSFQLKGLFSVSYHVINFIFSLVPQNRVASEI